MPDPNIAAQVPGVWQYLKDYGIVEAILAIGTIIVGWAAIFRGNVDKKSSSGPLGMPINGGSRSWDQQAYLLSESLQIIRDIREDNRVRNAILLRLESVLLETNKRQADAVHGLDNTQEVIREQLQVQRLQAKYLEEFLNNQVMLGIPRRKA